MQYVNATANGFSITLDASYAFYRNNKKIPEKIIDQIFLQLENLEKKTGKTFGSNTNPLLLSIRSNLTTTPSVLYIGMTEEIVETLAKYNFKMVYNDYMKLIATYSMVVMGYSDEYFNGYFSKYKEARGYNDDIELTIEDYKMLINKYKDNFLEIGGSYFPDNPREQLINTIIYVLSSWNSNETIIGINTLMNIEVIEYNLNEDLNTTCTLPKMIN